MIYTFKYTLPFVLVSLILFGGCTGSNPDTETDADSIPAAIESNWQQFVDAWESEDAAACAALFKENALHVPNGLPVNEGRESIAAFYSMLFDSNQSSRYSHQTESISFSDNLAVEYATFSVNWIDNEGEEWTYLSRALIQWKKDESGNWLIENFFYNQPES
ncbi:YybH family protein [Rhodohalobacter mucosus]|uniref:DUF4440 domain-containing protein n=1 Tax=Rhodohalobacter mucosus TaxID=2079485 RepID=A0A316TXU0_9BACT|nr:nuclear transport factor 2 family protein [Rhodohalobacter mucosus]PWN07504.1 hypothetical protein DDZ15_04375 [Rhodohalobacter mucosus]